MAWKRVGVVAGLALVGVAVVLGGNSNRAAADIAPMAIRLPIPRQLIPRPLVPAVGSIERFPGGVGDVWDRLKPGLPGSKDLADYGVGAAEDAYEQQQQNEWQHEQQRRNRELHRELGYDQAAY